MKNTAMKNTTHNANILASNSPASLAALAAVIVEALGRASGGLSQVGPEALGMACAGHANNNGRPGYELLAAVLLEWVPEDQDLEDLPAALVERAEKAYAEAYLALRGQELARDVKEVGDPGAPPEILGRDLPGVPRDTWFRDRVLRDLRQIPPQHLPPELQLRGFVPARWARVRAGTVVRLEASLAEAIRRLQPDEGLVLT